ncbi:MAG: hypothetical protein K0Q87_3428 [Neobacillus sp.]|jgi:hypothetical protein|nr:hypothetical protein [Neobacillus sp.]
MKLGLYICDVLIKNYKMEITTLFTFIDEKQNDNLIPSEKNI